jgi:hypothetical protein
MSSIATLLLYFYGTLSLGLGVRFLLIPSALAMMAIAFDSHRNDRQEALDLIGRGVWSGAFATLAYDAVRAPVAYSGVPIFKAISYFGTVITGTATPSLASEWVGWTYHLSNGVGFAIAYVAVVGRPRWWTAVTWGVLLELAMLMTPYAEVFGYKRSQQFIYYSLGGHVVYGLALWLALVAWSRKPSFLRSPIPRWGLFSAAILAVGLIGADFHRNFGRTIPPSPPPALNAHLYTTWDVIEADRIAALWVVKRFIDPKATFYFTPPFTGSQYGNKLDIPESAIRRMGTKSATEMAIATSNKTADPRLEILAHTTHLMEVTPWMLPMDHEARRFSQAIVAAASGCPQARPGPCFEKAFRYLDRWYSGSER